MNWEFTGETKVKFGITLKRIRASVDFTHKCGVEISKGDVGGWIEKESNLSGDAWVYGDAEVYGNAEVYGDAWVFGKAKVCGDAEVYGNAQVYGNAEVCGKAKVSGNACVCGNAEVFGNACVCGNAEVYGNAQVYGNAEVCGNAQVSGNAEVKTTSEYCVFKNTWSSLRWFTYTNSNRMWKVGCFHGSGEELIKKACADSDVSGRCYAAVVRFQEEIEKAVKESEAAND